MLLPKLRFNQLAENVERSLEGFVGEGRAARHPKMPSIPPKSIIDDIIPLEPDENPTWFAVMSPREIRGVAGPFSIPQLRQMYKYGEINDKTLFWKEGEMDWLQLINQRSLRPKLLQLPMLPPRIGSYNAELEVFDPILEIPSAEESSLTELPVFELTKCCSHCGGLAIAQLASATGQVPDLFKCREEVGTTEYASEILPGFLWVGNSGASKARSLKRLSITLLINCTTALKNPDPNPPYYRCRDCPMKDKPKTAFSDEETAQLLKQLDRAFDWIEIERTMPEKTAKSDALPPVYRGETNAIGLPLKPKDFKPFRDLQKKEMSRVLIWDRLGTDAACVVAVAYAIRLYGIGVEQAHKILLTNRTAAEISAPYMELLAKWAQKYVLGMLLCADCKSIAVEKHQQEQTIMMMAMQQQRHGGDGPPGEENQFDSEEDREYAAFGKLMVEHFPKLVKSADAMERLKDVSTYLFKVRFGFSYKSQWNGLMDLNLAGRYLNDLSVAVLFQLLAGNGLVRQLRVVNLKNNLIEQLGMQALLKAYFPIEDEEDDEEYFLDEQQGTMDIANDFELMVLDLSHNKLDEVGVKYLCFFLKQCNTLISFDVSSNDLCDVYCSDIIGCLIKPVDEFTAHHEASNVKLNVSSSNRTATLAYGDDDSIHSVNNLPLHNHSITSLSIGYNKVGEAAIETLARVVQHNAILRSIHAEMCGAVPPAAYKYLMTSIRLYNSTLEELVLSDSKLTVKTVEYISRIGESFDTRLLRLDLSKCGMRNLHMEALLKHVVTAKHLTYLDISGNPITDKGSEDLAKLAAGRLNFNGTYCPPLKLLDINNCSLTHDGCAAVVKGLASRQHFKFLDLSFNKIGMKCETFVQELSKCCIFELNLTSCDLKSTGTALVLEALSDPQNRLAATLKTVHLSENEVHDSAMQRLPLFLQRNFVLELLDLGFNELTSGCAEFFVSQSKVTSDSTLQKKLLELSINLIGNKCDPYLFEVPGMARAKTSFLFGLQKNPNDEYNQGYSHISHKARGHYLARKEVYEEYRQYNPNTAMNSAV